MNRRNLVVAVASLSLIGGSLFLTGCDGEAEMSDDVTSHANEELATAEDSATQCVTFRTPHVATVGKNGEPGVVGSATISCPGTVIARLTRVIGNPDGTKEYTPTLEEKSATVGKNSVTLNFQAPRCEGGNYGIMAFRGTSIHNRQTYPSQVGRIFSSDCVAPH